MKKLLSIYLCLSLAIMPTLAKADVTVSRAQQKLQDELSKADALLTKSGVKIYSATGKENVSLDQALKAGDFILDASSREIGILRVKTLLLTENGQLTLAISKLQSISDKNTANATAVILNLNKSAEENLNEISFALENIKIRDMDSAAWVAFGKLILAMGFFTGAFLLQDSYRRMIFVTKSKVAVNLALMAAFGTSGMYLLKDALDGE